MFIFSIFNYWCAFYTYNKRHDKFGKSVFFSLKYVRMYSKDWFCNVSLIKSYSLMLCDIIIIGIWLYSNSYIDSFLKPPVEITTGTTLVSNIFNRRGKCNKEINIQQFFPLNQSILKHELKLTILINSNFYNGIQ